MTCRSIQKGLLPFLWLTEVDYILLRKILKGGRTDLWYLCLGDYLGDFAPIADSCQLFFYLGFLCMLELAFGTSDVVTTTRYICVKLKTPEKALTGTSPT